MSSDLEREHGPEVTAVVTSEHRLLDDQLQAVRAMGASLERRRAFEELSERMAAHEAAEAVALAPVIGHLPGGPELRDQAAVEERELAFRVRSILRRMLLRPRARSIEPMLDSLAAVFRQHADFEELTILPLLASREGEQKRQMMGAWVEMAESLAPARPHPRVPRRLGTMLATGPVLAATDKLRVKLRRWFET